MFDFSRIKTIAVIGLSNNPDRPAYFVSQYMKEKGFRIIPINPKGEEVLGEKGYQRLRDIPADVKIDVANFFMRAEKLLPIVEEALERGIKIIWLQQGIVSQEAAKLAREKGAEIIMDRCIKVEHMDALSR
ncbi:MAG: CoA-binding protein [Bacillota bacterium]|jgi:hypothetical protein|uniref:CoA-binding protein n=1 Tax=Thermanaerosceptrum fracticalcis TaxID=1712410 RepID=A0A7G6E4X5_THEFR|nr:CoA-binding protein [Thermanaerosceptrum fracticalcis]MBZ4655442.1 CoA-binding protein [Peptococcaceae bacterium]QNB47129.1 CoA-binding protein [Thermanaerosceptrum fracticalcis]